MAPTHYTKITLAERPKEDITPTTFNRELAPLSELKPGPSQILVKLHYLSLDPAMRGWLRDQRSYIKPVQIGEVMRGQALAEVVEAGAGSKFKKGDIVDGMFGASLRFAFGSVPGPSSREPGRMERVWCIRRQVRQENRVCYLSLLGY